MPPVYDEVSALAFSIKEQALLTIGRDRLRGLSVEIDASRMAAHVGIALKDSDDANQLLALQTLREVQLMFISEVTMDFGFTTQDSIRALAETDSVVSAYV